MDVALLCLDPWTTLDGSDGCAIQLRALAAALSRAGHHVRALTTAPVRVRECLDADVETLAPGSVDAAAVADMLGRSHADLVLEPLRRPTSQGALAADRAGVPHVYLIERPRESGGVTPWASGMDMTDAFAASRGAIAFSGEAARWVRERAPRHYPVRVTNCGVDRTLFEPVGEAALHRAAAVLRPWEGLRVGFAGALESDHDLEILVRALGRTRIAAPTQLALIGDGPLRNRLIALAHEQRVSIAMLGAVPHSEVPAYLGRCDVVAVPCATRDGCDSPLKLIEAMAIGRALVASATEQARHHVRDGYDGLLVPVGDEVALASVLLRLVRTPQLRERLGANAFQSARRRRSWDDVAGDILQFGLACAERVVD